jgi:phosphoribosylformimino-5-aminoimidazole carboxamide ribotide isomerase
VAFLVIPSIDLRSGRVVRLREGDFARETSYGSDPVAVAERFAAAGARWLHLVDLDGAAGEERQTATVEAVVRAVAGRMACQVGGGLRDEASVAAMLDVGVARVVLGTSAIADPDLTGRLAARHGPDRVAAALDVRDGLAVGGGWLPGAAGTAVEVALARLADVGIERFVVTAIARDGALAGPDLDLLARIVALERGRITASGGVSSIADLEAVRAIGCQAAVVGRAIYEGRLDLEAALTALSGTPEDAPER